VPWTLNYFFSIARQGGQPHALVFKLALMVGGLCLPFSAGATHHIRNLISGLECADIPDHSP
jgi:hypothetical protein